MAHVTMPPLTAVPHRAMAAAPAILIALRKTSSELARMYAIHASRCWASRKESAFAITNALACGIRLVAAPYVAAEHPHLPQFPRDPGVCDYTPSTDAPAT